MTPSVQSLQLPVRWDSGAPTPVMIQVGNRCSVVFYAERPTDHDQVSSDVRVVDPSTTVGEVGMISFTGCYAANQSGYGWDELRQHRLWAYGLDRLTERAAVEVLSTPWASEYRGFRSQRPLRHFALLFPDLTMEFLAEDLAARRDVGSVYSVIRRELRQLASGS